MIVRPIHREAADVILAKRLDIASAVEEREFALRPGLGQLYGKAGRETSLQDAGCHLSFLAQALASDKQAMFVDHVAWAKVVLRERGVLASDLTFHLQCLADIVPEFLSKEQSTLAIEFVKAAVRLMPDMPEELPTFLRDDALLSPLAHQYVDALRRGERHLAGRMVMEAVAAGTPVKEIYLHVFQPAQYEIGRLWQINRITIAQSHYCTAATQLIMSQLYPHIFATAKNGRTLVAASVAGDLHEMGVRMVADFFEMDGWNTFYLGANTPHESVIATVIERHADVLAISATISYHVEAVRDLISAVHEHPGTDGIKIMTGGYPFNRDLDLWQTLGADGSATDAQKAITLAHKLLNEGIP